MGFDGITSDGLTTGSGQRSAPRLGLFVLFAILCASCVACGAPASDDSLADAPAGSEVTSQWSVAQLDDYGRVDIEPVEATGEHPSLTEVQLSPIEEALGLPVDANEIFAAWRAEYIVWYDAFDRCMANEGFSGFVIEFADQFATADDILSERQLTIEDDLAAGGYGPAVNIRFVFTQLGVAGYETDGSGLDEANLTADEEAVIRAAAEYRASLSESELEALNVAFIECINDEAIRELSPLDLPVYARQLPGGEILDEVLDVREAARTGNAANAAWDDWSGCMNARGFSVSSRAEAAAHAESATFAESDEFMALADSLHRARAAGQTIEPKALEDLRRLGETIMAYERRVVENDLLCSAQVDLESRIRAAINEAEERWLSKNVDRVALVRAENR